MPFVATFDLFQLHINRIEAAGENAIRGAQLAVGIMHERANAPFATAGATTPRRRGSSAVSQSQRAYLNKFFQRETETPTTDQKRVLAQKLGLSLFAVSVWFRNKRYEITHRRYVVSHPRQNEIINVTD